MVRFRWWSLAAAGLFAAGLAAGIIVEAVMPDSLGGLTQEQLDIFQRLGGLFTPFQPTTAAFIFFKNTSALVLSFMLSPLLLLFPLLALVFNGLLISFLSVIIVQQESVGFVLAGLLPHGVIEIPALIIGEAAALSSGFLIIASLFSKERASHLLPDLKHNLKYLGLALALMVPAAIIETYVTPLFIT